MAYKIAVGSSNEINVDLKFGEVKEFLIYEIEGRDARLIEKRKLTQEMKEGDLFYEKAKETGGNDDLNGCGSKGACGNQSGCGGNGRGCNGPSDVISKTEAISDCRAVLCKKVGFQAQKQFEKKAISVFDVECTIEEALDKITFYYERIDKKQSLRQ